MDDDIENEADVKLCPCCGNPTNRINVAARYFKNDGYPMQKAKDRRTVNLPTQTGKIAHLDKGRVRDKLAEKVKLI